jgi:hypothetical protein
VEARYACAEAGPVAVELTAILERPSHTRRDGRFTVSCAGDEQPHEVTFSYYQSRAQGRRGAVVVTPILGGSNEIAQIISLYFASAGYHALLVYRGPDKGFDKVLHWSWDAAAVERMLRRSVVDRRRAIDWLVTRPEVDPDQLGAVGVSMGAIATTVLAASERRLRAIVIILAGGDLPHVLCTSDEGRLRRWREARTQGDLTLEGLEQQLQGALLSDPLRLAPYIDTDAVLMFLARRDTTVPAADQWALYEALGRPELYVFPTGHYTSLLYIGYIERRAERFFARRFALPRGGPTAPASQ